MHFHSYTIWALMDLVFCMMIIHNTINLHKKFQCHCIWSHLKIIKNEWVMSLGSWPKIRVSVKMTYNVLEWEMAFQDSNQFLINIKVVHIVLRNIFSFGTISIWPTHKKLGLSAFQNSQMNWLINFSSLQLISWWIDDWGHSNKFKYALNDEWNNLHWLYLIMG